MSGGGSPGWLENHIWEFWGNRAPWPRPPAPTAFSLPCQAAPAVSPRPGAGHAGASVSVPDPALLLLGILADTPGAVLSHVSDPVLIADWSRCLPLGEQRRQLCAAAA